MTLDDAQLTERRAARLSQLLAGADPGPRALAYPDKRIAAAQVARARREAVRWRAAAAVAVLVAGSTLVPPVRAWIAGAAKSVWESLSAPPAAAPAPEVVEPPRPVNRVSFVPAQGAFIVDVAARQASGRIVIERAAGISASAEVQGTASGAELQVLPTGLRIVNNPSATADYVVRVPATIQRVQLRLGRERGVWTDSAAIDRRFVVELGRTAPSRPLQD